MCFLILSVGALTKPSSRSAVEVLALMPSLSVFISRLCAVFRDPSSLSVSSPLCLSAGLTELLCHAEVDQLDLGTEGNIRVVLNIMELLQCSSNHLSA